ncbi:coiled-coil domain-containing protein [Fictibacillus phosphorivorans]|uniref:coiled-coil domain-containing protein n=1 Tax=Fictibacillus phosphorivorans TaxID=1221500 RepID=UPI00203D7CC3|nr:hypothetical protein [Fictibacillus phosphorivorans]MCM3717590.1 hypothetical protein [Fictibacillus phosphorivorans]MCM3775285.1 hypothetical protein [Fictibacillus phosphorivorans]
MFKDFFNFKKLKKEWIYFGATTIVLILVSWYCAHAWGYNKASVYLEDKKVTLDKISDEIKSLNKDLAAIEEDIADAEEKQNEKQSELSQMNAEYEEVTGIINQKNDVQKEYDTLLKQVEEKKEEIKALDQQISDKQKELDVITKGIVIKKKEPRILAAGVFIAGNDIPPGRYKVEPNRGSGNYFVNSGAKVNIILGKGDDFYLPEYVFELDEGDEIEATLSVKYTLVE